MTNEQLIAIGQAVVATANGVSFEGGVYTLEPSGVPVSVDVAVAVLEGQGVGVTVRGDRIVEVHMETPR